MCRKGDFVLKYKLSPQLAIKTVVKKLKSNLKTSLIKKQKVWSKCNKNILVCLFCK